MHIYRKKTEQERCNENKAHTHTVDCQPNGQPKTIEKRRWSHIERWKAKAKQNKNLQRKTSIVQRKRWTSWTCTFEFCIFAYARFVCNVWCVVFCVWRRLDESYPMECISVRPVRYTDVYLRVFCFRFFFFFCISVTFFFWSNVLFLIIDHLYK